MAAFVPMRVLIDTNILMSALAFYGNERRMVEQLLEAEHTVVVTDYILAETERIVRRKFSVEGQKRSFDLLARFQTGQAVYVKPHVLYEPQVPPALELSNKKDAPILAAALQDEIDALVSGDKDFLENTKLATLRRKKIFSTRELLERL